MGPAVPRSAYRLVGVSVDISLENPRSQLLERHALRAAVGSPSSRLSNSASVWSSLVSVNSVIRAVIGLLFSGGIGLLTDG